jgi:hypothetical protein
MRVILSSFVLGLAFVLHAASTAAQTTTEAQPAKPDVGALRQHNTPGFLIVIFSPEVDRSNRSAAQGVVWNSFVGKLKKAKVASLEVVNEVAINEGADRARAFELAQGETNRFTIWLQFSALDAGTSSITANRSDTIDAERLAAKYMVFMPASNTVIGQGEVEQERIPESMIATQNNQKPVRDSSGRVINARTPVRLPDGSLSTGSQRFMDIDALKRVGEEVATRSLSAVKKLDKVKAP